MSCCLQHELSQGISERMTKELISARIVRRQGIGEHMAKEPTASVPPLMNFKMLFLREEYSVWVWTSKGEYDLALERPQLSLFFRIVTSRHAGDLALISTILPPHSIFQISVVFSCSFSRSHDTIFLALWTDALYLSVPSHTSSFFFFEKNKVVIWILRGGSSALNELLSVSPSSCERPLSKRKIDDQVPKSRARGDIRSTNSNTKSKRSSNRDVEELSNVDLVATNTNSTQFEAHENI